VSVLLATVLALGGCRPQARPLPPGTRAAFPGVEPRSWSLLWVVPAADFRVCAPAAAGLRRMQAEGGAPPLTVVFVGPHAEWMSAYLRSQRVRAAIVTLTPSQFRAHLGARPFYSLYRLRDGRVADVLAPNPTPAWEARLRAWAADTTRGPSANPSPREAHRR